MHLHVLEIMISNLLEEKKERFQTFIYYKVLQKYHEASQNGPACEQVTYVTDCTILINLA